jgi:hypothetical protein
MTAIPLHIQRRIEQRWASHSTGVKPAKECRDESHTINGSTPAVTKENPAEVNLSSSG